MKFFSRVHNRTSILVISCGFYNEIEMYNFSDWFNRVWRIAICNKITSISPSDRSCRLSEFYFNRLDMVIQVRISLSNASYFKQWCPHNLFGCTPRWGFRAVIFLLVWEVKNSGPELGWGVWAWRTPDPFGVCHRCLKSGHLLKNKQLLYMYSHFIVEHCQYVFLQWHLKEFRLI